MLPKANENSCFFGEIFTFLPNQTSNLNVHCFVWGKFTSAALLQHSQGTFGTTQELNPYELADPKHSLVPEGFLQPSKTFWICCFVLSKSKHKMCRICLTVKYLTVRVGYVWEIVNRTQIDREICLQKGKYFAQKNRFFVVFGNNKIAKFADHIRSTKIIYWPKVYIFSVFEGPKLEMNPHLLNGPILCFEVVAYFVTEILRRILSTKNWLVCENNQECVKIRQSTW